MRPGVKKLHLLKLFPKALVLTHGHPHGDVRYLTFDDGPDPKHTPPLLDLLGEHDVKASFFLVGEKIEKHPKLVRRIVAEGHLVGNHSYSHRLFHKMKLRQQLSEIRRTDMLLSAIDPQSQHRIRTPQGHLAASLMLYFACQRRAFVHWSYDSRDYQRQPLDKLVARLRNKAPAAGDIVLMHDDHDLACRALRILLPEWLANGHRFHALPREPK